MSNRVPPQNVEAERAALGSILLNNEALGAVAAIVGRENESWYEPKHATIFAAILALSDASRPVDEITLIETLSSTGKLERAGGMTYISDLARVVPTSSHAAHYAKIVREAAQMRAIIRTCEACIEHAMTPAHDSRDSREIISEVEQEIFALSQNATAAEARHIADDMESAIKEIEAQHKTGIPKGLMTGFEGLDGISWGFQPSDMIILAARPSVGKTAWALNIATGAAQEGKKVLVFSLEMSHRALQTRVMCALGKVRGGDIRTGFLPAKVQQGLVAGGTKIQGLPIWVVDAVNLTPLDLRTQARRMKSKRGLDLIVIDYLQLMRSAKRFESRRLEVEYISWQLKCLARELDIPVLCLSQLTREGDNVDDGFRLVPCLRESGSIEQDADQIITLAKPTDDTKAKFLAKYPIPEANREWTLNNLVLATVAKHRNGPTGYVMFLFKKDIQQFEEWATVWARMQAKQQNAVDDDDDPLLANATH